MDRIEGFKKAGSIHHVVTAEAKKFIQPGKKLLEIAEFIERRIREEGGGLAFPLNSSLNEVAAHYVAQGGDEKTVEAGDLLKIDLGVEVDGYIADGAFTWSSKPSDLSKAAELAIEEAVKVIRPGVKVGEVSQAIEDTVTGKGLGLIVNLTGHGVDRNEFHAPPTVSNTATNSPFELEEGMVIAIEPFVAESNGVVKETAPNEIYRFLQPRPVRMPDTRKIQEIIQERFQAFPFAKRWLYNDFSQFKVALALKQLEGVEAVESYPPLKESRGQMVAQAEHTVIVQDKPVVTTKGKD